MPSPNTTDSANATMLHANSRSAGLARNWWAIAIRAVLAAGFAIGIFWALAHTFATLALFFAVYVAADGVAAIVAGLLRMKRGELWQTLIFEGTLNLFFAGAILVWPAIVATAFVGLSSIWAVATGSLLLAAARRTSELRELDQNQGDFVYVDFWNIAIGVTRATASISACVGIGASPWLFSSTF